MRRRRWRPTTSRLYNDYASPESHVLLEPRRRPLRRPRDRRAAAERRRRRRRPRLRRARRRGRRPRARLLRAPRVPRLLAGRGRARTPGRTSTSRGSHRGRSASRSRPAAPTAARSPSSRTASTRAPERSFASVYAHRRARALPSRPVLVLRPPGRSGDPDLDPRGHRRRDRDARVPGARRPRLPLQLRRWFSATAAQHDHAELRRAAPLAATRRGAAAVPAGALRAARGPPGRRGRASARWPSTYARVTGKPFAEAFHRFAVSVAADYADDLELAAATGARRPRPALRPLRAARARRRRRSTLTVTFPRGRAGAAATLVLRRESKIPGEPPRDAADRAARHRRRPDAGVRRSSRPAQTSALLVVSNGGGRAVRLRRRARAEPLRRAAARRRSRAAPRFPPPRRGARAPRRRPPPPHAMPPPPRAARRRACRSPARRTCAPAPPRPAPVPARRPRGAPPRARARSATRRRPRSRGALRGGPPGRTCPPRRTGPAVPAREPSRHATLIVECWSPPAVTAAKPLLRIRSAATSSPAIVSTSDTAIECAATAWRSPSSLSISPRFLDERPRLLELALHRAQNAQRADRGRPPWVEPELSRISVAYAIASSTGSVPRCSVMQTHPRM